jgi:RNA polymerase sigma-32 factor
VNLSNNPHLYRIAHEAPAITAEQEVELLARVRENGDRRAADLLARAHLRLVITIARQLSRYPVSQPELIAEGNLGIVQAMRKFEPGRGRFATYATYWIRAYMLELVVKSRSLVGSTRGAFRTRVFFKLRRERAKLPANLDRSEVERLLAERLGISAQSVARLLDQLDAHDVSLDVRREDGGPNLLDQLSASDDQEQLLANEQARPSLERAVGAALGCLAPRERYIAEHRLMPEGDDVPSLAQVGRELGVSRERARQLEVRTKEKLRKSILAQTDRTFFEAFEGGAWRKAASADCEGFSPEKVHERRLRVVNVAG